MGLPRKVGAGEVEIQEDMEVWSGVQLPQGSARRAAWAP